MTDAVSSLAFPATDASARRSDAPAQSSGGASLIDSGDFSTFLGLLTTQLQYQDPMDPMNTEQFVTQLTQFSQLEQSVRGNDTLDAIRSDLAGRNAQAELALIGRSVLTASDQMVLSKDGGTVRFEGVTPGDAVEVRIADSDGTPVATFPVTATEGQTVVEWRGRTDTGARAPDGLYTVEIRKIDGEGKARARVEALSYATVSEVRLASGGADLVLDNGMRVAASAVKAVR